MKKIPMILYYLKIILLISSFYFIFIMLHNFLDAGIYGYIFLMVYIVYVYKLMTELFSKKKDYKEDVIYNFMQIGFIVYILVVTIRCYIVKLYVTIFTFSYFRMNYIILSILVMFILAYSFIGSTSVKKQ